MKQILITILAVFFCGLLFSAAPTVTNVSVTTHTGYVTISYDLTADGNCQVIMLVSNNGGDSYTFFPTHTSGAIGNSVSAGTGKQITWHPAQDGMSIGTNYKIKLIARDNPSPISQPVGFITVEGGTFNNGTSDVTISTFYLDKYEITQGEYQAVMGTNPADEYGVGNAYPVYYVTWFNAIEYCNTRSMQENLTPCYSYKVGEIDYGTNPGNWPSDWNTPDNQHNVNCSWTANGYRLPTEMEWMFAARGGNLTNNYTYSGSNDIDNVAWYTDNSGSTTHPVGGKQANELQIFDMSGNVWEWCWDFYGDYPSEPQTNPTGPTSGYTRVCCGGSWNFNASNCTVSSRDNNSTIGAFPNVGFRVCRHSLD
ncbi:MAG: formylglycine-generating enzyme family protein [Candidatus Cloacimonas acidaminovorans]|nr:formylglycine-generating enzyme family protein [Candidatus Cloacimonas acidaminovorans]